MTIINSSMDGSVGGARRVSVATTERRSHTIAVMNSKGGCGKSTISTNLATLFASEGIATTIVDYDPQGSSIKWLNARPQHFPPIYAVSNTNSQRNSAFTRTWQIKIPPNTERVILDTPAGIEGFLLDDIVARSNIIIIPVLPSAHDIRATAEFVGKLYLNASYRRCSPPSCVVANRVVKDSLAFGKLQRFLFQLKIPFISTFSDSRYYLHAAEKGMGICELTTRLNEDEMFEWDQLVQWVNDSIAQQNRARSFSAKQVALPTEQETTAAVSHRNNLPQPALAHSFASNTETRRPYTSILENKFFKK